MTISSLRLALPLLASLVFPALPAHAVDNANKCTYVEVAKLPLRYTGPKLVPAVDGVIDGTPATMLVDTGADQTYLTRTAVEKRGLSLRMTGLHVQGVSGLSRLYSARLKEIVVGPARSARVEVSVIGETVTTPSYDAIVGAGFLLQSDLELSLRDKELKFFRARDCGNASLAYWKEDAVEVPFESNFSRSSNPHFTVLLNGKKLDAVIDSGAQHTVIMLDAAKRVGIKLDSPGVRRLPDVVGVGTERVAHYSAVFETLAIGGETIRDAEIGIIDSHTAAAAAEVYLGQDFLRAHRVLFAMSQEKLYLAYLGGAVFGQRNGIEPWMRQEADAGNPDAQFALATIYRAGRGVARDQAQATAWLEKAAAQGQPQAELLVGRGLMLGGQYAQGAVRMKSALDKLPAERYGALWLYLARLRSGEPENAKRELQATFARSKNDEWPAPIADFYLGRIDADSLLASAGKGEPSSRARSCQATAYVAELRAAQGDKAQAAALRAAARPDCAPNPDR